MLQGRREDVRPDELQVVWRGELTRLGRASRFMQESRNNIENTLKAKEKEIAEGVSVLAQKAKVRRPLHQVAHGRGLTWFRTTQYYQNEMSTAEGCAFPLAVELCPG